MILILIQILIQIRALAMAADLNGKRKPRTQSSLPGRNPIDRQTCKQAIDKWKPTKKNPSTWPKTLFCSLLDGSLAKKKGAINCAKNMKLKSKRDKNYEHHRKHNQKYFTVSM